MSDVTLRCPKCQAPMQNTGEEALVEAGQYNELKDEYTGEFEATRFECLSGPCSFDFYCAPPKGTELTDAEKQERINAELENKAVVVREGAASRTVEELRACFVTDACGLLDCNPQQLVNDELYSDANVDAYEQMLGRAGFTVVWNDGYVIYQGLSDQAEEALRDE